MTKEQLQALGVKIYPNGDNPRRTETPEEYAEGKVQETPEKVKPLPWDDPFRPAITIKVAGVDAITKELERIRKELHSLNEIMKRRKP